MKRTNNLLPFSTVLAVACSALLFSCSNSENGKGAKDLGHPDPDKRILVKSGAKNKAFQYDLTDKQIVEQAFSIDLMTNWISQEYFERPRDASRGFLDDDKDLENGRLYMSSLDVINGDGEYYKSITHAFDIYIVNKNRDTLAVIPTEEMKLLGEKIEAIWAVEKNYNEIYKLLEEGITFYPIASKEVAPEVE